MKRFFIYTLVSTLVTFCTENKTYAQIGRSDWTYGLVLQTDNPIYFLVGDFATFLPALCINDAEKSNIFYHDSRWWFPEVRWRYRVVKRMEFSGQKATIHPKFSEQWGPKSWSKVDWGIRNFSAGYHFGWLSRLYPIGFDLEADYIQEGFDLSFPDKEDKMEISKKMLSATALAKIRLLKYDSNRINPIIEIGGSYNYALHYKDENISDKDAVNNGVTGIIGLGFVNTELHIQFSVRYEQSFYDFYNKDFEYKGNRIFQDTKSNLGCLSAAINYSF